MPRRSKKLFNVPDLSYEECVAIAEALEKTATLPNLTLSAKFYEAIGLYSTAEAVRDKVAVTSSLLDEIKG